MQEINAEKSLLVVLRHPPGEDALTSESLDLAMACGAFIPATTLLFRDAGVLQLLAGQAPDLDTGTSIEKTVHALREYGITRCHVHSGSLARYGLRTGDLCMPCTESDDEQCRLLMKDHDQIIGL